MSENVMSARRKVVIGILSLITIGCICIGIYFLTRKSDKNKQNSPFDTFDASDNKSKGIGLLIFGIFLFVITVFIAISPNNDSYPSSYPSSYPYSYPYPYSDVGYNLDPYPYEDQYITIPVTYRPKQFPYPYPF